MARFLIVETDPKHRKTVETLWKEATGRGPDEAGEDGGRLSFLSRPSDFLQIWRESPEEFYLLLCNPVRSPKHLSFTERLFAAAAVMERSLRIKVGWQEKRIPLSEIYYICRKGRKLELHGQKGALEFYGHLSRSEEMPGPQEGFLLCHQSYLVNLQYVERREAHAFRLQNGEEIPISQKRCATARDVWLRYITKKR
jgi:hypothetical protein